MTELRNFKTSSTSRKYFTSCAANKYGFYDEDEVVYLFKSSRYSVETNLWHQITYSVFILSVFYTTTFLPFGKFYNRLGGNVGMLLAYLYVFAYLGVPSLKKNATLRAAEVYVYYTTTQYSSNESTVFTQTTAVPTNFENYETLNV